MNAVSSPHPLLRLQKAEVGRAWQQVAAAVINKHQGSWMDRVQKAPGMRLSSYASLCGKRP